MSASTATFASVDRAFYSRLRDAGVHVDRVLDIGAFHADWTRSTLDVFPDAWFELFEPLAQAREDYRAALCAFTSHTPRARVHALALSDTPGRQDIWLHPKGFGSSLVRAEPPDGERLSVEVRRLDDVMADLAIPQPQIVKIDAEGSELGVIKGGEQTFAGASVVQAETWLRRNPRYNHPLLHDVSQALRPLGFVLVHLGGFWRRDDQELFLVDGFFMKRALIDRLVARGAPLPWASNDHELRPGARVP